MWPDADLSPRVLVALAVVWAVATPVLGWICRAMLSRPPGDDCDRS